MTETQHRTIFHRKYMYFAAAILCIAYTYLTFSVPPSASAQLQLSSTGTQILRFSFVLLYGVTLFIGVRSILAIWEYSHLIYERHPEIAKGLIRVGYGLLYLILGLGVAVTFGAIRNIVAPPGTPITGAWEFITVITNYVYIIFPAVGLWIIFSGARMAVGEKTNFIFSGKAFKDNFIVASIFSLIITFLYSFLTFTNPTRQVSADLTVRPSYVISDPLILFTLILPTFLVWVLGILAAFELDRISLKETSAQFRLARRKLVNGLWEVIFASILVQVLLSLGGIRLMHLGLFFILFAVYGYFILLIIGYFTIMRGANKLRALQNTYM